MKKLVLLCFLGYCELCQAQNQSLLTIPSERPLPFSRKAWLVGFQVGYSTNSYIHENYSARQVYGGYFVANKVAFGLAASWGRENFLAFRDDAVSAGPMVRYQITRTRFSPFIVGAYQVGQATVTSLHTPASTSVYSQTRFIQSRYVGLGLSIRVLTASRLDLLYTWQTKPAAAESGIKGVYHQLQAQFGANYIFGSK